MKNNGFSLMETMVAVSIFSYALLSLASSTVTYLKYNSTTEKKSEALAVVTQMIEEYRQVDPATMPSSGYQTTTRTNGSRTYTVRTDYCLVSAYCTSTARHLKITASYKNVAYAGSETVFTQLQ